MRSGPSARTTSCKARRQRKRAGGPSGTRAKTSAMGSGLASKRSGRELNPASARKRRNASQPNSPRVMACAGMTAAASSGMWLSRARRRETRCRPSRALSRAIKLDLIFTRAEADLLVPTGLGIKDREPRQIEAEAGIDLVAERGQPLNEK